MLAQELVRGSSREQSRDADDLELNEDLYMLQTEVNEML